MTNLDARVAARGGTFESAMEKAEAQKSVKESDTDPKSLIIKALQDKIAELQKPAQEEITELPRYEMDCITGLARPSKRGPWVRYVDIRASKGEKT